jgi:hypothetical protein
MSNALKHSDALYLIFWISLVAAIVWTLRRIEKNTENLIAVIRRENSENKFTSSPFSSPE